MESLIKKANQDLESTLSKLPTRRTLKNDVERVQMYNHYNRLAVNELYYTEYLNQETNKRIKSSI